MPEASMSPPDDDLVLPPQASSWKRIGIAFGVVVVAAACGYGCFEWSTARNFDRASTLVEALRLEAEARPAARPVLRGEPLPGNAWDDYALALDQIEKARKGSVTTEYADAIALMRRGVRRAEARQAAKPRGDHCQTLAQLAVDRARALREAGQTDESLDLMLEVAQFARDVEHNGSGLAAIYGANARFCALEALHEALARGALGTGACARLARELEILDRSFPSMEATVLNAAGQAGSSLLEESVKEKPSAEHFGGKHRWRFGFSPRRMAADRVESEIASARRIAELAEAPWRQLRGACVEYEASVRTSKNPAPLAFPHLLLTQGARDHRARLRLLRVAAHWKATGEVLELDDPFDGTLSHERVGKGLRVWSVGPDGFNGGTGGWRQLVLEVP